MKAKLEEGAGVDSPTYRETIAQGIIENVINNLSSGEPGCIKDAIALLETLEGKPAQEIAVTTSRPIVFDPSVSEID